MHADGFRRGRGTQIFVCHNVAVLVTTLAAIYTIECLFETNEVVIYNFDFQCCLNWNVYDISVNCEFYNDMHAKKWTSSLKLVVILAQCRYTKTAQKYINTVTYNTPVLLRIKYSTVWYMKRYSMSTYTGVAHFQKQSGFLAHSVSKFLYGAECWTLRKQEEHRILTAGMGWLRKLAGESRRQWKKNEDIRLDLNQMERHWYERYRYTDCSGSGMWIGWITPDYQQKHWQH